MRVKLKVKANTNSMNVDAHSPSMTPSIILFGGSFNPPHRAHFRIAHAALDVFAPASMQIIPSGQPWQKPHVAPAEHRLAMLRLAVADDQSEWQASHACEYPITINPLEIERDQPSYTIDTVRALHQNVPKNASQNESDTRFIWLIGSDQLANFHTWRDWRDILQYTHIAVAQRAVHEINCEQLSDPQLRDYYRQNHCTVTMPAWRQQRHGLFIEFPAPAIAVSSTQIRAQIHANQTTPDLTKSVEKYILKHGLYK